MWSSAKNEIIKRPSIQTVYVLLNYMSSANSNTGYLQTFGIFNLKFKPEEMIVKNIIIYSGGATGTYIIKSDLVEWHTLAGFSDGFDISSVVNAPFQINNDINGTYTFNIYKIDGITPSNLTISIIIQLEFIKY